MKDLLTFNTLKLLLSTVVLLGLTAVNTDNALASRQARFENMKHKDREYLINLFQESEFDKEFLERTFHDSRLKKMPVVVNRNVVNKENPRNYSEFHSRYSLWMANRFSKKWRTTLKRASRKFQVDREVMVAILLVETGFGNILGRYPIISVFSSIILEEHKNGLHDNSTTDNEEEIYRRNRLKLKSEWAKKELAALLKISKDTQSSPFRLRGSFAGAFGIPQFLPSSYLKWGYDSDQSGSVNLFLFPDAIYSIANYLKAHGWQKGLYRKSNKRVVWQYNHSQVYVNTVLGVAQRIREHKTAGKQNRKQQMALLVELP